MDKKKIIMALSKARTSLERKRIFISLFEEMGFTKDRLGIEKFADYLHSIVPSSDGMTEIIEDYLGI
jgi:hypothetical protein